MRSGLDAEAPADVLEGGAKAEKVLVKAPGLNAIRGPEAPISAAVPGEPRTR